MREEPKPSLHLVETGGVGGRVMDVKAGSLGQPGKVLGSFLSAVVAHNQVELQVAWNRLLDLPEEAQELLVPVAGFE